MEKIAELDKEIQSTDNLDMKKLLVEEKGHRIDDHYKAIDKARANRDRSIGRFGALGDQVENMVFGDGSAFNSKLYEDVIKSKGMIAPNSVEAEKAAEYVNGAIEKVTKANETIEALNKGDTTLYNQNILEAEAKTAEQAYQTDVLNMRPTTLNDNITTLAIAEDTFNTDDENLKTKLEKTKEIMNNGPDDIPIPGIAVAAPIMFGINGIIDKIKNLFADKE